MKAKHVLENRKFDDTLPVNLREEWLMMIRNWESRKSNPNPYTHKEKGIFSILHRSSSHAYVHPASNLAEVRRKLAEADEEDIMQGDVSHQVPGSVFVREGLEIEERQLVPPDVCQLIGCSPYASAKATTCFGYQEEVTEVRWSDRFNSREAQCPHAANQEMGAVTPRVYARRHRNATPGARGRH